MRPGLSQFLCIVYLVSFWGWSGSAYGAAWQDHRDAGFRAFDSGDYPKAVEQFEAALSFANEARATAQDLGILLEHLATAYLADSQYQRAQEAIDRWDRILAANEDQAWAADHQAVRGRLAAFTSKAIGRNLDANASSPAVTPPQPSDSEPLPPAASESYAVHLASFKSKDNAVAAWETLKEHHPILLEGKRLALSQIDLGDRGVFFRVVALPFESATSAQSVCAQFKKQDQYCVVMSDEQVSLSQP